MNEPDHPGGNERFQFAAAIANLLVGRQHDPALLSGPREPLLVGGVLRKEIVMGNRLVSSPNQRGDDPVPA